ncbi:MAG: bacteriocin [Acidobacteriota bacterium]
MSKKKLVETENLEIEALSDDELESVSGGKSMQEFTDVASCVCCLPGSNTTIKTGGGDGIK